MAKKKVNKEEILFVRISKATNVVWEGRALSVSSKNSNGEFDILGMHSNFITLVRDDPIKITTEEGEVKEYTFKQSVISVNENRVNIFSNIE
jgi:F0F1-type ATP synthase epsilon subunit